MPSKKAKVPSPRKVAATTRGNLATGPQMSPSSRLQVDARMKRTQVVRSRPKKPSAEEAEQLASEWETVTINHLRWAKSLLERANETYPALTRKLIKNLWCHTTVLEDSKGDPTLTRADILGAPAMEIVRDLASGGMVQNLAIDITLLSEGWLFHNAARPSHVMVLRDEYPCRPYNLCWRTRLFEKTTHVAFQPLLQDLIPCMPAHGFRALFPKMRSCCIQVGAMDDRWQAVRFVNGLLPTLERLAVFVNPGYCRYCTSDAPMWVVMRDMARQHPNLVVFPHQIMFRTEWEKLLAGQQSIWESRPDEEVCENLSPAVDHTLDWRMGFFGSWRWHEDAIRCVEDSLLLKRRRQRQNGKGEGATAKDKLDGIATDAAGLHIPGLPTLDEEFRAMFPLASRLMEDPHLETDHGAMESKCNN